MNFIQGNTYTREEISNVVRGSVQAYLPYIDDRVVCGCFDRKLNPHAPEEILFGKEHDTPIIDLTADMVYQQGRQGKAIPVFVKKAANSWEYLGEYLCIGITRDERVIRKKMEIHPHRGPFSGVLRFERV